MPRPRSLSHDQLAAASLRVIDRDGLAALSMRAVAKELGTSTMALYRYVHSREELEAHVVELVLSSVETEPPPDDLPWRRRIEIMVRNLREAVGAHAAVVPLTLAHRHRSRSGLRWSEGVLTVLATAGIEGERRVVALRSLLSYVIGAIQLEHLGPLPGEGTVAIAELPADEFPRMTETARHARGVSSDQEFMGGLEVVLRGLVGD